MAAPSLDTQIDQLYALPLDQFTAARNDLARARKGDSAAVAQVKALTKPSQVPWAVNLLYWKERATWKRLMAAGQALRKAQLAALEGRTADVRHADATHRDTLADAVATAGQLAAQAGGSAASDPLTRMLEALSLAPELPQTPGRYTEVIQPAGFEALAGMSFTALAASMAATPQTSAPAKRPTRTGKGAAGPDPREVRRRLEAEQRAAVATRDRLAGVRARAEASRALADTQVAALRQQLERAEATLTAATSAERAAERDLEAAEAAVHAADERLRNA